MNESHRSPGPSLTQAQYAALKHCLKTGARIWLSTSDNAEAVIEGVQGWHPDPAAMRELLRIGAIKKDVPWRGFCTPTDTARLKVRDYEADHANP